MSKSKKSSSSSTPSTPDPQSEWFFQDGVLQSQRVYDPTKKGYKTEAFSSPDEKAIQDQATGFIKNLVGQVPNAFNMSPESLDSQVAAYTDPQKRALTDSYNQAKGELNNSAGASGMRNSVGFGNYTANQLEKNKAQGMADIEASGQQYRYNLPRMALAPYMDAFNLYNAALEGQQAQQSQGLDVAMQGSNAANNFALQNYQNQLNRYQLNNQKKSGGFLGGLFGGF
jgi:hypothetical protein